MFENKKYDFSFTVSALEDYTNENTGLIAAALYSAPTISEIEVIAGQKSNVKLNKLAHTLTLAAKACGGWSAAGSTVLTQQEVTVCPIQYEEALCPADLETKWFSQLMRDGSNEDDFPFAQFILEDKMKALSSQVEYMFWQGNSAGGSGNLALCNGILYSLSGNSSDTYWSGSTDVTSSGIIASINGLILNMPEVIYGEEDVIIYCSSAVYRTYIQALITANLYNYADAINGKTLRVTVPGHNVEVIATGGLRGTDTLFLTTKSNMVFVTDLLSETSDLDMWWSKDNREVRIAGQFMFGAGVYFPEYVIHNVSAII